MTLTESTTTPTATPVAENQQDWNSMGLKIGQLEAEVSILVKENKTLRALLDRVIEHRQKSHSELVLLLTGLVSKLPINDVGVIVARLMEHNTNVSQMLAALAKGATGADLPQPEVLKNLEQTKRDLAAALQPVIDELIQLEAPLEKDLLEKLPAHPELFFAPKTVRANRCFIKGHIPRERVLREFGNESLVFFNDMTTDPKLNPRPKPDEIALAFRNDFESLFEQQPQLLPGKRELLLGLFRKVQRSKSFNDQARAQRNAFHRLSFLLELLYFYNNQNTEAPDVLFAQRLPALVEQLAITSEQDALDERLIAQAEKLISYIVSSDHQHMVVNNIGKGGGNAKTLKYVLRLRTDKVPEVDQVVTEFVKHLVPSRDQRPPSPESLTGLLRLLHPEMQRLVVRTLMRSDRMRREDAEALGRDIANRLGIPNIGEPSKKEALSPEQERKIAWGKIKDLIAQRTDAATVAAAIRDRLHANYDAEEIRQSWITLTEADPISLIRIFCHLPYLSNGNTDAVARAVMETYVSRLTHEKYAAAYNKVLTSLRSMFHAKADSPTLLNFVALVRWISPEAANKISTDIGLVPAH